MREAETRNQERETDLLRNQEKGLAFLDLLGSPPPRSLLAPSAILGKGLLFLEPMRALLREAESRRTLCHARQEKGLRARSVRSLSMLAVIEKQKPGIEEGKAIPALLETARPSMSSTR